MPSIRRAGLAGAALLLACEAATPPSDPGGSVGVRIVAPPGGGLRFDAGRVHLQGPTPKFLNANPGDPVNIPGLAPGTYILSLEGLIAGELEQFGQTTNIRVAADSTSQVTVTMASFVPGITSLPASSGSKSFTVGYNAIANAVNYQVETATDPAFTNNRDSVATSQTSRMVTVPTDGAYYVRVRAFDEFATRGRSSALDSIRVQACSNCWLTPQAMPTARENLGVGVVNDVLYAVGGDLLTSDLDNLEAFDPAATSNVWTPRKAMPTPRTKLGVGVLNGLLYAVGGSRGFNSLTTVESYNPGNDSWSAETPLNNPRSNPGVGVIDGILYAVGGDTGSVEAYDPVQKTWNFVKQMPTKRTFFAAAVLNKQLYVIGGRDAGGAEIGTVQSYDPATDNWTTRAPLNTPRAFLAAGTVNGVLYAVGGQTFAAGELTTVEAYDPVGNSWSPRQAMSFPRGFLAAGVVSGLLYSVGGSFMDGESNVMEVYEP